MPKRNNCLAMQIGTRIHKKRKEMHLTQEELADRSGLSQSFLTCIERGEKGLGSDSIIRISHALTITTDYLLTGAMLQEESDYIHSLFARMSEAERERTIEIVKGILLIGGHTLP